VASPALPSFLALLELLAGLTGLVFHTIRRQKRQAQSSVFLPVES